MRLIDADALKEEVNKKKVVGRFNMLSLIDNAPTVAVDCKDCDGYEAGYSAGLKDAERPQGKWIRKVDEVGFISHICSECGAEIEVEDCSDDKFCFNCGALMKGDKE